jgi:hypothetical protein
MRGSRATSGLRTGICAFFPVTLLRLITLILEPEWGIGIFVPALFHAALRLFVLTQIAPPRQFSKTYNTTREQNMGVILQRYFVNPGNTGIISLHFG